MSVLPSGTLSQTLDFKNFAKACQSPEWNLPWAHLSPHPEVKLVKNNLTVDAQCAIETDNV